MSIDTMTGSAGNWPHGCAQATGLWLTRGGLRVHSGSRVRVQGHCSRDCPALAVFWVLIGPTQKRRLLIVDTAFLLLSRLRFSPLFVTAC